MSHTAPDSTGSGYQHSVIAEQVRRNLLLIAAIIALAPFAIDAYLPAIPQIAASFGIDSAHAESSVSIFLVLFALGQLVGGPIADRRGRRVVTLFGIAGFALASGLIVFSVGFVQFMVLRGLQAFCGGLAIVACFSVTRDAFNGRELSKFVSVITSVMLMAPMVAPFFGSAILIWFDWRWIFGAMTLYALLMLGLSWWRFGETLNPMNQPGSVWKSYRRVLGDKQSLVLLFLSSLSMTVMFTFLTSSSSVYQDFFALSAQEYSLLFSSNVLVILLLTNANIYLLRRFSMRRMMGIGIGLQLLASFGLVIASQFNTPLWLFVVLVIVAVGCMGIVLPNGVSALMTMHYKDAGTVNALGGLLRFTMGGTLGAIPTLFANVGFAPMAITMCLLSLAGCLCWLLLAGEKPADLGPESESSQADLEPQLAQLAQPTHGK